MESRIGERIVKLAIAASIAVLAADVAVGQTPSTGAPANASAAKTANAPAAKPYVPPRTPDGQPDISGMYEPGYFGQPAETAVGGPWRPPPPKGGKAIGPTDFGARDAVDNDPTIAHIKPTTHADGRRPSGRQDSHAAVGRREAERDLPEPGQG